MFVPSDESMMPLVVVESKAESESASLSASVPVLIKLAIGIDNVCPGVASKAAHVTDGLRFTRRVPSTERFAENQFSPAPSGGRFVLRNAPLKEFA